MERVDVSVLVPVYNNAGTLDCLIDRLLTVFDAQPVSFEIVLVDDGSQDTSLAILERRAASDARIRVFALVRNFGSQAASCAACDLARGARIVHIDADLEILPEDIPQLLAYLDRGYDLVCGFRENRAGPWLTRRLPSMLMNHYVRRRTGTHIRDVGCGLRAFDAHLIRDLAAEGEARRLMTPVLLRRARRVAQVPIRHQPKPGRHGQSFRWVLGIGMDYYLLTARRPFLVSGLLAATALAVGLSLLALGPRLFGLVLSGAGMLGRLLSLAGEYVQRIYHLAQGLPFYRLRALDDVDGEP